MKLLPITAALLLLAGAASAQDMETVCAEHGKLAETIMTERQTGAVMTEMMERLRKASEAKGDPDLYDLAKYLIIEAYDEPRWEGAETKANAILDFRNAVEHDCFTGD